MIRLEQVTKQYGSLTALRDISFQVREKETVGLLGRNGAGKTTLLNLLTGYFPPTAGHVLICGKDMQQEPGACKRRIGFLPERPPLYDEMTTEGYLRFVSELREVRKRAIGNHVDEILTLCGLQEVRSRPLGQLSRGYRQRAGIAQALCGAPEILIFDEPTVGLDPKQTVEIRRLIRALSEDHTVIFSSHILSEVQQTCSRVIILEEGRMVRDLRQGDPETEEKTLRLRLKVAGAESPVMKALKQLEGVTGAELLPAEEPGVTEARLTVRREGSTGAALDRAFRALAESGLAVRLMREEKETLEEVFLRAVGK